MLTPRQHQLLLYINDYQERHGVSPSFDEMRDSLKLKSKSGVHRLIKALQERNYISRLAYRARAIEILRLPPQPNGKLTEKLLPDLGGEAAASNVIVGNFRRGGRHAARSVSLPLVGRIAAGKPIEAVPDDGSDFDVPASLVGDGDHYVLEVQGDSMIDAGIHEGDMVVIKRADRANSGDIVVARIRDSDEVTLKRFRLKADRVLLEPANEKYHTRICAADEVEIQGLLAGLVRRY
ncbi:MAG: transcriptional repressor LexA [Geminicoccaceae bacterium]